MSKIGIYAVRTARTVIELETVAATTADDFALGAPELALRPRCKLERQYSHISHLTRE
jgi:hypothetical protein